uniref:C2H2-type domain-containing protein n=1 Tax=Ananas comosus var. bracteatus TaxID=296719 RepID=A0A6V7PKY9_ANACO|nr:unnamed protein product [Ananas comosus var. bracteatus]
MSYHRGSNPTVDSELRLGPNQAQAHACSLCSKSFNSLQALGGHQTAHRKEMEEIRRKHGAMVEAQGLSLGPSTVVDRGKKGGDQSKSVASESRSRIMEGSRGAEDDLELKLGSGENIDLTLRL